MSLKSINRDGFDRGEERRGERGHGEEIGSICQEEGRGERISICRERASGEERRKKGKRESRGESSGRRKEEKLHTP